MSMSAAVSSSLRSALLAAALLAAPALVSAQGRGSAGHQVVESIVITAPTVKARTAPAVTSLSIEDFSQGWVFPLAAEEFQSSDWYGIVIDGRVAYVPRAAAAPRARGARRVAQVSEPAMVTQAGSPAPAAAAPQPEMAIAPAAPERRPAPAPAVASQASASAAAPSTMVAAAQAPAAEQPRATEQPASHVPAVTEAAPAPAAPATPVADKKADQPVFNARRSGLNVTFGMLASATPIKTAGLPQSFHVSGNSFIGVRFKALGLYGAPEMGQGAGYKSTMLGGGASLDLINMHFLRVTALGGYTTYEETTVPTDSTVVPVTTKLQGPSVGGMASIPFIGPLRLAYRGQYMMATYAGIPVTMTRHYVGLVF